MHLRGIQELGMAGCNRATITDEAFLHLRWIKSLYMEGCDQVTITPKTIAQLVGIVTLKTAE